MGLSLKPDHVKRYGQLATLLYKYGHSDLVRAAGLEEALAAGGAVDLDDLSAGEAGSTAVRRTASATPAETPEAREADELADDLERLGPTYVKLGQLLSTRIDLLPAAAVQRLERLQDRLEPFPFEQVEQVVCDELGVRISKAFLEFAPEPLGSASLGQVHHAVLRDGRAVAVKVQRPGIRARIRDDLEVLGDVAAFLDEHTEAGERYHFAATLQQLRRAIVGELDYRQEARNLEALGENLRGFERIVVPAPIEDYTTSRVLTMEYVRGRKITALSPLRRLEVDGEGLADELFRAYLRQILVDGFFHADPHPGNVFLTDDGRLALIDLGMVAHLGPALQERLLRLIVAVSRGEGDDAADILVDLSQSRRNADIDGFRSEVAQLVLQGRTARPEEIHAGAIFLQLSRLAGDHGLRTPAELTMLGKTLLNLDEVGRTLDPAFDPNAAVRHHAAEVMQHRMLKRLSPSEMFSSLLEMNELVRRLPGRLNDALETIARNELRVRVDAINEDRFLEAIQKIANRVAMGLVLAALIVGAAMLVRVESPWTILGYPAAATLFFLAAAAGGVMLVISILRGDRPEE